MKKASRFRALSLIVLLAVPAGKLGQPYRILIQSPDALTTLEPMKGKAGARAAEALSCLDKIK